MAIEIALTTRKFQMHVEIAIWKKPGFSSIGRQNTVNHRNHLI